MDIFLFIKNFFFIKTKVLNNINPHPHFFKPHIPFFSSLIFNVY